eukprot:1159500-Pelagomonas_calceolata.AAC.8
MVVLRHYGCCYLYRNHWFSVNLQPARRPEISDKMCAGPESQRKTFLGKPETCRGAAWRASGTNLRVEAPSGRTRHQGRGGGEGARGRSRGLSKRAVQGPSLLSSTNRAGNGTTKHACKSMLTHTHMHFQCCIACASPVAQISSSSALNIQGHSTTLNVLSLQSPGRKHLLKSQIAIRAARTSKWMPLGLPETFENFLYFTVGDLICVPCSGGGARVGAAQAQLLASCWGGRRCGHYRQGHLPHSRHGTGQCGGLERFVSLFPCRWGGWFVALESAAVVLRLRCQSARLASSRQLSSKAGNARSTGSFASRIVALEKVGNCRRHWVQVHSAEGKARNAKIHCSGIKGAKVHCSDTKSAKGICVSLELQEHTIRMWYAPNDDSWSPRQQ